MHDCGFLGRVPEKTRDPKFGFGLGLTFLSWGFFQGGLEDCISILKFKIKFKLNNIIAEHGIPAQIPSLLRWWVPSVNEFYEFSMPYQPGLRVICIHLKDSSYNCGGF